MADAPVQPEFGAVQCTAWQAKNSS
ncbi:uncharacterized protein METZ01_LOCUS240334, partial [marine metagenome]